MFKVSLQISILTEAQKAIAFGAIKLAAGGPAAELEAALMVRERVFAGQDAVPRAATGTGPIETVRSYRRSERANIRRLSK